MADEKTSQLSNAATLDGSEYLGIVQTGANVKTTTYAVSNFVNGRTFVQMGAHANGGGEAGVAIGYYAAAYGSNAIAIGNSAYGDSQGSISIGYHAATNNPGAIAIGSHSTNHGNYAISIGPRAQVNGDYAIAFGAYSSAESNCIAIGPYAKSYNSSSIAIGGSSKGYGNRSVALGYRAKANAYASVAIGYGSYADLRSVAIGARCKSFESYSVSIGMSAECLVSYSIAIGPYAYVIGQGGVAIGAYSNAQGERALALAPYASARAQYSVALGAHAETHGNSSLALGAFATTEQANSTVIGSGSSDLVMGSLVISGYPVEFTLRPCEHYQKFVGQTVAPTQASVQYGLEDGAAHIRFIYDTPGTAGNAFFVESNVTGTPNADASLSFSDNILQVLLGSDGDDIYDPTKNTIAQIAALFPAHGFTFSYDGDSSITVNSLSEVPLSGGSDGTPSVVLTADGNSPTAVNTLAVWEQSIATLTGRVTGAGSNIFSGDDDAACFVLTPLLMYADDGGNYNFIGTPTFTLENSTEGAADWEVPTLAVDGDTGYLEVTVVNNAETVNWMAHFKFETSQ